MSLPLEKNYLLHDAKKLIKLSSPLIVTLLAYMGMNIVDAIMMGRLGKVQLAAGAIGGEVFTTLLLFCIGMGNAVGVLTARHYGAEEHDQINRIVCHGFYLAALFAIPCMFLISWISVLFHRIGLQADMVEFTKQYLNMLVWGFPAMLGFIILREFVSIFSRAHIVMIIACAAIPLNAVGNYLLMYGKLGLPEMGIAGIGLATTIVEWLMLLVLILYIYKSSILRPHFRSFAKLNYTTFIELIRIGSPSGTLMVLEHGLFAASAIMMGYFGANAVAAHQIAIQCTSVSFMFPAGISQATALLVSQGLGANNPGKARNYAYLGLGFGLLCALVTIFIFLSYPHYLVRIFLGSAVSVDDTAFLLAKNFLWIAAVFHFFDAIQGICNGALRGFKDTFVPLVLGLVSYWFVGLGSGYLLAFGFKLGGVGLWWGLAAGIIAAAFMLYSRLVFQIRSALHHRIF